MKTFKFQLTFYSFWMYQDKGGQNLSTDNSSVKEEGLPIFGGKAIKGLVREEYERLYGNGVAKRIFGSEFSPSKVYFNTARISEAIDPKLHYLLYKSIARTALTDKKNAQVGSLRTDEVAVPITLTGMLSLDDVSTEEENKIVEAIDMVKMAGKDRHKGMGRCKITILKEGSDA